MTRFNFPQDAAVLARKPLPNWLKLAEVEDYPPYLRNKHARQANKVESTWHVTVEEADDWSRKEQYNYVRRILHKCAKIVSIGACRFGTYLVFVVVIEGIALPEYVPYLDCSRFYPVGEAERLDREIEEYQMQWVKTGTAMLDAELEEYMEKVRKIRGAEATLSSTEAKLRADEKTYMEGIQELREAEAKLSSAEGLRAETRTPPVRVAGRGRRSTKTLADRGGWSTPPIKKV